MARVVRRAASAAAWRAPSRAILRRARKHKVVMESVTQEKKKLRSVICFEAKAPTGYTFIPAGNPHLTTTCKEWCRKQNLQIFAVSHVHRIGYHFPSTIVADVCTELGLHLTSTGKTVPFHTLGSLAHQSSTDSEASQEVINTEARDTIKDLFPNIPDKDLFQIIKMSFQKGQHKVGTASELPMARRAQLAVVAHVRHVYTDYDRLLKEGSFQEARATVEQPTLAKVVAWRGDDENGQTVLEDIFREVIVISDDDDSELEEETTITPGSRDLSVEILSNTPRTHEIQTQPISVENTPNRDPTRELSEESSPGFRIITKMPAQKMIDRRGFSRYQAWNRALNRYRAETQRTEQSHSGDAMTEQQSPRHAKRSAATQENPEPVRRREVPIYPVESNPRAPPVPFYGEPLAHRPVANNSHVGTMERRLPSESHLYSQFGAIGRPKTLTMQKPHEAQSFESSFQRNANASHSPGNFQFIKDPSRPERIPVLLKDNMNEPVLVGGPRGLPIGSENQLGPNVEPQNPPRVRLGGYPQDHILPSIEAPWPPEKRRSDTRLESLTKRMSLRSVTPVNPPGDPHDNGSGPGSPDDQNSKRRRLAYYPATQHVSHSVPRDVRPIGLPVSEEQGPRVQYRYDDLRPERRPQDMQHPRDYPPLAEPSLLIGHQRERPAGPFASQISLSTRRDMDRTCVVDPSGLAPVQNLQPSSGVSGMGASGDRTSRAPLDASRREVHPSHYGDRSPRVDHVRHSKIEEPRLTSWNPRTDGNHVLVHDTHSGKQYADGFIRSVDHREGRPVEYFVEHSRHQPVRLGEAPIPPSRTRILDQRAQDISQPRAASEQRQIPSPRVAKVVHPQVSHYPDSVFGGRQPQPHGRNIPRERRPGSGLGNPRRVHDPRAFQMAEQSRPIYVQRVETQSPQHSMSDGRPVVIVD